MWQRKIAYWEWNDIAGGRLLYAIIKQFKITECRYERTSNNTASKRWWSLTKKLLMLYLLDITKSVVDDNVFWNQLHLHWTINCFVLNAAIFPSSWKISRITPEYKKVTHSDSTNYQPIAIRIVLPTLSHVFEQLLMTYCNATFFLSSHLNSLDFWLDPVQDWMSLKRQQLWCI